MSNYLQKPFDKTFVKVVEELYITRAKHGKFTKRKELLTALGIIDANYAQIKKAERGVPTERYEPIKRYLRENYAVNPDYLEGKSATMFLRSMVSAGAVSAANDDSTKIDLLTAELAAKNDLLVEKERFITFQQTTIDMLQHQVDRLQSFVEQLSKKQ